MSVSYGGDVITFSDNSTIGSGWTGMKNRIINGDMRIDQRYNGSSNTPSNGTYTIDRWNSDKSGSLACTIQQVNDGPTGRFQKSLKITVPSGTVNSTDFFGVRQVIENSNFYDIGSTWGTANPLSFTISFWVKSSLAGKYYFSPRIPSVAHVAHPYTINQANTWEYKTITVIGPTNFTPLDQNTLTTGSLISIRFWTIAGSSESGATDGVWGNAGAVGTGMANLAAAGGTWQITGVQVERGTQASSFEYRPYGTELQLCQRYFEYGFTRSLTTTTFSGSYNPDHNWFTQFKVEKRGSPTVTRSNATDTQITFNGITPNVYGFTSEFDATVNGQNSSQFNFSANSEL